MTAEVLRQGPAAELIRRHRLIAVLRRLAPRAELLATVDDLADAGVRCMEVTLDAPSGAEDLRAAADHLRRRADGPFAVGAGTVLSIDQLDAAQDAGADFIVAPVLDAGLLAEGIRRGLPFIPGAFTPSEIRAAWDAGATFVKLFPASSVGPAFVRELRGPLPEIELIPTGGLDASLAREFLDAGAVAVGMGSSLVSADAAARREMVHAVIGAAP